MSITDPTTGLPALPEGQYWRVYRGHQTCTPFVSIHEKCTQRRQIGFGYTTQRNQTGWEKLWGIQPERIHHPAVHEDYEGSRLVRRRAIDIPADAHITPASVRRAAQRLLEDIEQAAIERRLLGDYPPNRLED